MFSIRTMKGDIERLRQGLPIRGVMIAAPAGTREQDAARRLATKPEAHSPSELPPKEVARPLPSQEARIGALAATPAQPPVPRYTQSPPPAAAGYTVPVTARSPFATGTTPQPIEVAARPQARPTPPISSRAGTMEVEKPVMEPALTLFARMFPTRKRLAVSLFVFLFIIAGAVYALFAYFGRPLPGTRLVLKPSPFPAASPSVTPAPSPVSTPALSQTPSPAPSPTDAPIPRSPHLPVNRIALIDLPAQAVALDLAGRLASIASYTQEPGDFTQVVVRHGAEGSALGASEFFATLGISTPEGFFTDLGEDAAFFFYAPRETKTAERTRGGSLAHFGMLIPVKGSAQGVAEKLREWEATLGGDLAPLTFGREWLAGTEPFFHDRLYQGATIRYQNFPDPYMAVDYAVFEGGEPTLLIFTTSRESMLAVIGILNYRSE